MEWKEWIGKKVFVALKSGTYYTGKIIDIDDKSNTLFITMLDKYNKKVIFVSSEIKRISEEEDGE